VVAGGGALEHRACARVVGGQAVGVQARAPAAVAGAGALDADRGEDQAAGGARAATAEPEASVACTGAGGAIVVVPSSPRSFSVSATGAPSASR
jgi:hypothetical protein